MPKASTQVRKKATITLSAPPFVGTLRTREYLQRTTLEDIVGLMKAVLQKAAEEARQPSPDPEILHEGVAVATLLLDKIVGVPRLPFDEAEAQGTVVVDSQTMLADAQAALAHLNTLPLQKYLETSTLGMTPPQEEVGDESH